VLAFTFTFYQHRFNTQRQSRAYYAGGSKHRNIAPIVTHGQQNRVSDVACGDAASCRLGVRGSEAATESESQLLAVRDRRTSRVQL